MVSAFFVSNYANYRSSLYCLFTFNYLPLAPKTRNIIETPPSVRQSCLSRLVFALLSSKTCRLAVIFSKLPRRCSKCRFSGSWLAWGAIGILHHSVTCTEWQVSRPGCNDAKIGAECGRAGWACLVAGSGIRFWAIRERERTCLSRWDMHVRWIADRMPIV